MKQNIIKNNIFKIIFIIFGGICTGIILPGKCPDDRKLRLKQSYEINWPAFDNIVYQVAMQYPGSFNASRPMGNEMCPYVKIRCQEPLHWQVSIRMFAQLGAEHVGQTLVGSTIDLDPSGVTMVFSHGEKSGHIIPCSAKLYEQPYNKKDVATMLVNFVGFHYYSWLAIYNCTEQNNVTNQQLWVLLSDELNLENKVSFLNEAILILGERGYNTENLERVNYTHCKEMKKKCSKERSDFVRLVNSQLVPSSNMATAATTAGSLTETHTGSSKNVFYFIIIGAAVIIICVFIVFSISYVVKNKQT